MKDYKENKHDMLMLLHLLMSRAQAKERCEGVENPGEDTIKCEFNILLADLL